MKKYCSNLLLNYKFLIISPVIVAVVKCTMMIPSFIMVANSITSKSFIGHK